MAPAPAGGTLRPAKAAHRYRPGQAPAGYADAGDSDDESGEEDEEQQQQQQQPVARRKVPTATQITRTDGLQVVNQGPTASSSKQLKVQVTTDPAAAAAAQRARDAEEESESEEEESEEEPPKTLPKPSYRPPGTGQAAAPAKEESSEYESSSEEESEEESKPIVIARPVFVSKRNRDTLAKKEGGVLGADDEEAELKLQAELEERRKQSTYLAGEAIKRGLADKESGDRMPDVDDTDGLDPEGEFEAWKLRELMRIKRDKEAIYAREKEREEIEARRAIPEALRLKEDTEHAKKLREEKMANRGQQNFLQKYHHKGAFYADDNADVLSRHDFHAATESTVTSVDNLPKIMQVRNYGKMGRTKYTHLADQDTTDRAAGWAGNGRSGGRMGKQGAESLGNGCFHCGGPHMKAECPDLRNGAPSGANAGPIRSRPRSRSRSPERGSYRDRERRYEGDRRDDRVQDRGWRSRDHGSDRRERRRSRSRSRSRERYGDDKRRRRD